MANTLHTVETSHGTVKVRGYDVTFYESVEEWVKAHREVIATALSLTSIALQGVIVKKVIKH